MRLPLDTPVFLWAVTGSSNLKAAQRRVIQDADEVFVSAASIWEIAIKTRLGKLKADSRELATAIESCGFTELPVRALHAAAVDAIPLHHNDPFDHLLIAQAMSEPLRLMTADAVLARYTDLVLMIPKPLI
jgi:PIN domain nuclease of toxin-antitoxin system